MNIERWPSAAVGRSRTVAFGGLVWTVSNARNLNAGFEAQAAETLQILGHSLEEAGSDKGRLLSIHVILVDMTMRETFDTLWRAWIGPDPQHWPQRAVYGGTLAPGLLLEVVATAARSVEGPA